MPVSKFFEFNKFIKKFILIACYNLYAAGNEANIFNGNYRNILIF